MVSGVELLTIMSFGINGVLVVLYALDTIYLGNYTLLDYPIFIGYLAVSMNFIKRMMNKKQVDRD